MTKSLIKDTLQTVKKNISRYISLMLIVALGTAFFVGIKATAPDMFSTAEQYFTDYNLMDIRIQSSIGLTDEDLAAVSKTDGIQYISGVKFVDALVKVNDENEIDIDGTQISTRAYGFSPNKIADFLSGKSDGNYINRYELIAGKFPSAPGECLVDDSKLSTPDSYSLGSVISLFDAGGETPSELKNNRFTIVGIIRSPYYLSFERGNTDIGSGKIGTYIIIPEENFTTDYYTEAYIKVRGTDSFDPFSDAYFEYVNDYVDNIESVSTDLIKKRVNKLRPQLLNDINEGEKDIADRTNKVNTALSELNITIDTLQNLVDNGASILADAQKEFDAKFASAGTLIVENKEQYAQALAEYKVKLDELTRKKEEYAVNEQLVENGKDAYDILYAQCTEAESKIASIAKGIATTKDLIDAADAMLLSIMGKQVEAFSNEEIQGIINVMQTTYPDLYKSVKSLTTQGLATEIIAYLSPYMEQQKASLAQQEKEITEKQNLLKDLKAQLDKKNIELQSSAAQLATAKKELDTAQKQLSDFFQSIQAAGFNIQSSNVEFEIAKLQAETELKELRNQVEQAPTNLELAKEKRNNAITELDSALEYASIKLNDAKSLFAKLDTVTWSIFDRNDTPGYASYGQSVENIKVLANIFPIFFFLISSLICLTTMTRLVDEDRVVIGTYEALGYSRTAIISKYVFYSLSACILGTALGISAGIFIFPFSINSAYSIMYSVPQLIYNLPTTDIIIGFSIAFLSTTLSTAFAIAKNMTLTPAVLMRPKAPKAGKRIFLEHIGFLWNRLSFTGKVTARNLFRNKLRFLMTMVGIAGSCAMLLASLGMYNSISAITSKQYGSNAISKYDFQIVFDDAQDSTDKNSAYTKAKADARIESLNLIAMKSMNGYGEGTEKKLDVYVLVPEEPISLPSYIDLRNRSTGEKLSLTETGAVITEQLAKKANVGVGDTIFFSDSQGREYAVIVSSITENYTFHYIYMTPNVYRSVTGANPEYNYAIGNISEAIKNSDNTSYNNVKGLLVTDLIKTDGVTTVAYTSDTTQSVTKVTDALSLVILVFFVSALILAFVVLYNLTNINIIERTRELATLKVLGFSDKELYGYIYRENTVVSLFGIIFGIGLGIVLHKLLITFTAIDTVMYGQEISVWSFFVAVAVTVLFIVAVNLILRKKLKNIDMVLSLKSVE